MFKEPLPSVKPTEETKAENADTPPQEVRAPQVIKGQEKASPPPASAKTESAASQASAQSVISIDDSPVKIIQIRCCKSTTIELDHRTEIWRDNRNSIENHRSGLIHTAPMLIASIETGNYLEALDGLLLTLDR